ncbi:MAG TPA: PilZ domain-containing protein [Terriglobales bacterium]|nr:PilZ domain-containing protein [Terriglobales bacterium]
MSDLRATSVIFSEPVLPSRLAHSRCRTSRVEVVLLENEYPISRRWARHKVDVPVYVITHGPTKVAAVQGRGSDLNCGGMTLYAGIELGIGDQVGVEFTPPYSGRPITVRCFVRNGHGGTYGVEFITENDADYENVGQIESILRNVGSPVSRP